MRGEREQKLLDSHHQIVNEMVNLDDVCNHLLISHALTIPMFEDITSQLTSSARAIALNIVMSKRPNAYDNYYKALYDSGNKSLAALLEPHVSPGVWRIPDAPGGELTDAELHNAVQSLTDVHAKSIEQASGVNANPTGYIKDDKQLDKKRKQMLQKSHQQIVNGVANVHEVCNHLLCSRAITLSMQEDIMRKPTIAARVAGLNNVMSKRHHFYDTYYEALYNSDNKSLAGLLEPLISPGVRRIPDAPGGERIGGSAHGNAAASVLRNAEQPSQPGLQSLTDFHAKSIEQASGVNANPTGYIKDDKQAFATSNEEFLSFIPNGIIRWGIPVQHVLEDGDLLITQANTSDMTPLLTVLLEGAPGSGKTALAAAIAKRSDFPYIKICSPENMIGYHEDAKCRAIEKIFYDAHKSPLSCIILDDIERLLDYVRIGPSFSNIVLQVMLVLLKKAPPKGRKLMVIGTTSCKHVLQEMEMLSTFIAVIHVSCINMPEYVVAVLEHLGVFSPSDVDLFQRRTAGKRMWIGIKKLLMVIERAKQVGESERMEKLIYLLEEETSRGLTE